MRALSRLGAMSSDVIEEALKSSDPEVRKSAVEMLSGRKGSVWPWPWPQPRPRPSP
jgi:hypothetical protein